MRPDYYPTILHVSVLAALLLTLDADSKDSTCESQIRVHHGQVYEAPLGKTFGLTAQLLLQQFPTDSLLV
ncbi:hypothetical protein FQN60_006879 [Etheostoma spectabile]|uniref:Reelin domain-containing protein n=1 Tax=Etheostoma spectabile TaxID=54343 RepID=A0A5J5CH09_9PERO|nr:hypothetical protein FQN60_006879 [Etheostoma spectabile]